jgi:hypothetical protein
MRLAQRGKNPKKKGKERRKKKNCGITAYF